MDPLERALASPDAPDLVAQVARLYRVMLGRIPDPGGLRALLVELHAGVALRAVAARFLASGEFAAGLGGADPRLALCRNAFGPGAPARLPEIADLPDLVEALIRSPELAAAVPVLPALFPDGLLLREDADYRIWLAAMAADRAPSAVAGETVSILIGLDVETPGLQETLDSVLALDWPGLGVVLAGRRFSHALRQRAAADPRLRLVRVLLWRSLARLQAAALARCRGAFAAVMTPGDRLNPAGAVLAALRFADIVLSDEDALDAAGLRHDPLFGAAWDMERMLAAGCPGLVLVRTTLLRRACGWGAMPGSWELLRRVAARAGPGRIVHVPAILLSRRGVMPRPGAHQVAAVRQQCPDCTVDQQGGTLRIRHPLPHPPPRTSIIIATRDRAELLGPCLAGLLERTDYPAIEVVIVDNGSTAPDALALLDQVRSDERVRVLTRPGPFNWAALNNDGVAASTGAVIVLLNNDTAVIEPGWLSELVAQASRPDVGAVGAKLLYPDGTVQHAGMVLSRDAHAMHMWSGWDGDAPGYLDSLAVVREVSAVTGACLAMRRAVFDTVGGCDAANLPVTWNDVDLCLRVRSHGLRVVWTPYARLLHREQASRGTDDTPENEARFRREQAFMRAQWGSAMVVDPFLNPQLLPSQTLLRLAGQ